MSEVFYEVADRMSKLYISHRRHYVESANGKYYVPKYKGTKEDCTLTDRVVIEHLNRQYAIAVFAGPYSSPFVCFDVDIPDKDVVRRLVDALVDFGFPREKIYISSSGGKGYHVEMFFTGLTYTYWLKSMYDIICANYEFDSHKIEFRPTDRQAIKLPLSVHYKTGNVCWYLDQETLEPIEDIGYILNIEQIDRDWAMDLIRKRVRESRRVVTLAEELRERKKGEGEPEVEYPVEEHVATKLYSDTYPMLVSPGTRHNAMKSIAVYERYKGTAQEEIVKILMRWIDEQDHAFYTSSREEVLTDAEKLAAFVWSDKFCAVDRNVFFNEFDIRNLLKVSGRMQRRILFLIIALCKRHRVAVVSAERIAHFVGTSGSSAGKMIKVLVEKKIISYNPGRKTFKDGRYIVAPNHYLYNTIGGFDSLHIPLDWDFKEESFGEAYLGLLRRAVPADEWDIYFTKKELEELRNDGN